MKETNGGRLNGILSRYQTIVVRVIIRRMKSYGSAADFRPNRHDKHYPTYGSALACSRQAKGARVISVSSWGHHYSPVLPDGPNFEHREYDPRKRYGQSKTANILFALELDHRGKER